MSPLTGRFPDRFPQHAPVQPVNETSHYPSPRPVSQRGESSTQDHWEEGLIEEIRQLFGDDSETILEDIHERVDRVLFEFVLNQTEGNISEASKRLGISRPTLRNRLRQLRLDL